MLFVIFVNSSTHMVEAWLRCVLSAAIAVGVVGALGEGGTDPSSHLFMHRGLQLAVPSHRRELQTQVSTSAGLLSALANTAVGRIVLAPGTYILNAQLNVTRSVVLEAAVAGSVVLDAQASSGSPRRVLIINAGSLGVVQLIGLNITGGYMNNVRAHAQNFPSPRWEDG